MKKISILDCTLRDGGSLNNYLFGEENILQIFQMLNNANIDIIETGFIDNNKKEDKNCSINPSNTFFDNLSTRISNKKCHAVAMVDLCKYNLANFNITESKNLDGIRIMFKKEQLNSAIDFAQKIKQLNYKTILNPVSITSYSNEELNILFEKTNKLNPYTIYIIDTYGLLNTKETSDLYDIFNKNLNKEITIGYHSHNNLQLSFANSIEIINKADDRNIIIDASLYGMGKRAGNAPIELIAQYMNTNKNKDYNLNILTPIIEEKIAPLLKTFEWGYSLIHYTAATNKCHSDYVSYLYREKNLPFEEINRILKLINENQKLTFNKQHIDNILTGVKNG